MATVGKSYKQMLAGGQRFAAVYHIGGMDWCAYSDPALTDAFQKYIDDYPAADQGLKAVQAYYQALFWDFATETNTQYSQDKMQFLPILDRELGPQKIKYDDVKAIDVGSWSVSVSRETAGYVYTNGPQEGWGLPGLDWIIDPDQDATVNRGVLSRDYEGADLFWVNDQGLSDRINNLAGGEKILIYTGSRAIYVLGGTAAVVDAADGVSAPSATTTEWQCTNLPGEGAIHSPDERVYGAVNNDLERIEIFDVPNYESVVGLWAYLFLVPINEDGTIEGFKVDATEGLQHDLPILFRSGEIASNPSADPGSWKITHSGITKSLQAELPTEKFNGSLGGYQFSRSSIVAPSIAAQLPHIGVIEVDDAITPVVTTDRIFLCAAGAYVRYETRQKLLDATVAALNASGTLNFIYSTDGDDITVNSADDANTTFVYGPAAMALGLGYIREDKAEIHNLDVSSSYSEHTGGGRRLSEVFDSAYGLGGYEAPGFPGRLMALKDTANATGSIWQHDMGYTVPVLFAEKSVRTPFRNRSACNYFIQWDWADLLYDFGGEWANPHSSTGAWQVPPESGTYIAPGNVFLYLNGESDATQLDDGDAITVGIPGNYADAEAPGLEGTGAEFHPFELIMNGKLGATPAGSTYIELAQSLDGDDPGYDHMMQAGSGLGQIIQRGLSLYYAPGVQDEDPWKLADSRIVTGTEISKLLRGLLGDQASDIPTLPRRIPITTIPNLEKTAGTSQNLIDWAAWETLDGEGEYSLVFDGKTKILDAMTGYAFTHGKRLTYGYNETERTWILGLSDIGSISAAEVTFADRDIGTDIIRGGEAPKDIIGSGWIYSSTTVETRREADQELVISAKKTIGRTAHIAGAKALAVKDKLSVFADEETGFPNNELIALVEKYGRLFATTYSQMRVPLTADSMTQFIVGDGSTITWDALLKPTEGRRSADSRVGIVTEATIRPDKVDVLLRTGTKQAGIAPSLFIEHAEIDSIAGTTITVSLVAAKLDPTNNLFADPAGGLTDLAMFGCLDYSTTSGSVVQRDSTCGAYAIWLFERGNDTLVNGTAARNVFSGTLVGTGTSGTLTVADVAAGQFTIRVDDATNLAALDAANANWVVIFADRDSAALKDCQTIYGWLGDKLSQVEDSTATKHRCISWG